MGFNVVDTKTGEVKQRTEEKPARTRDSDPPSTVVRVTSSTQLTPEGQAMVQSGELAPSGLTMADMAMKAAEDPQMRTRFEDEVKKAAQETRNTLLDANPSDTEARELRDALNDSGAMDQVLNTLMGPKTGGKATGNAGVLLESGFLNGTKAAWQPLSEENFRRAAEAEVEAMDGFLAGITDPAKREKAEDDIRKRELMLSDDREFKKAYDSYAGKASPPKTAEAPPLAKPAPQAPGFRKEMDAAFDHAFGRGSAKTLHEKILRGEADDMRPILDKETGQILGLEVLVKKNAGFIPADSKHKNGAVKIVISMSPAVVALDSGRPAKVVMPDGAVISSPPQKWIRPEGTTGVIIEQKTACETPAKDALLILADDGKNGGGKFAVRGFDGRTDFTQAGVKGNVTVDLSQLQTKPGGAKMSPELRAALGTFEAKPPPHPSGPQPLAMKH